MLNCFYGSWLRKFAAVGYLLMLLCGDVHSHGRLWDPPGRSTLWRKGFSAPVNYDDHQLYCGGKEHQRALGGKCGLCGDPWDANPRLHEAGGIYARDIIAATYGEGQTITVTVDITVHHKGWFEFRLCQDATSLTQDCLNRHVLQLVAGSGGRYNLPNEGAKKYEVALKLPSGVTCNQCVMQWKYNAGNDWGCENGRCATGLGPQEQFYGCADIRITGGRIRRPTHGTTKTTARINPSTQERHTGSCIAVGAWRENQGMTDWCQINCSRGYCPPSYCRC